MANQSLDLANRFSIFVKEKLVHTLHLLPAHWKRILNCSLWKLREYIRDRLKDEVFSLFQWTHRLNTLVTWMLTNVTFRSLILLEFLIATILTISFIFSLGDALTGILPMIWLISISSNYIANGVFHSSINSINFSYAMSTRKKMTYIIIVLLDRCFFIFHYGVLGLRS